MSPQEKMRNPQFQDCARRKSRMIAHPSLMARDQDVRV
jgi:hypothetical protein